jgi:tRNA 2-thiouridine synthesizing protein D
MNKQKTLTFAFMDPPFESERTTTFFRLLDATLEAGANINVFAYEGAVALSFAHQKAHGNSVHGRDVEQEAHPLSREWIAALQDKAAERGVQFSWINCGLCVDERGVNDVIDNCGRGSPADLWKFASAADNTLIIGTR